MRWAAGISAIAALAAAGASQAAVCKIWGPPQRIGLLDVSLIKEASGIAASRRFSGRLYHNNDSGDGPNVYVTDAAGRGTRTVAIAGFTPTDVEDIAVGPCAENASCLYVGDIGDNFAKRQTVDFVLVVETAAFEGPLKPLRVVHARYPDKPHDAEAFAVHPNGDLFLVTKPVDLVNRRAGVAQVFRLTAAQLAAEGEAAQTFEPVGDIDLPYLLYENNLAGQLATGLDIAPDGSRFVLITYQSAIEVGFDLSKPLPSSRGWAPGRDYRIVATAPMPQTEAVSYAPDGEAILYDTELTLSAAMAPIHLPANGEAPLYRQACEAR